MTPLLEVSRLRKEFVEFHGLFHKQRRTVINDVSFTLGEGQTLALAGETGSGKSTLAKLLAGVLPPTSGEIKVMGEPLHYGDYQHRCQLIRMIFQDPNTSLNPRLSIGRILETPLRLNTDMLADEREMAVVQSLRLVGLLPDHYYYYPQMMSAAEKRRVALARALILNPRIIVADEALTTVDVSMRSQIINLMLGLQERLGLSYIFVTHHLGLARHMSDKILMLHQGEVVEYGDTQEVLSQPQHEVTQRLWQSYQSELRK